MKIWYGKLVNLVQKEILGWKYPKKTPIDEHYLGHKLTNRFNSPIEYIQSIEPFLFNEMKTQFEKIIELNKDQINLKASKIIRLFFNSTIFCLELNLELDNFLELKLGELVLLSGTQALIENDWKNTLKFGKILKIEKKTRTILIQLNFEEYYQIKNSPPEIFFFPFKGIWKYSQYLKEYFSLNSIGSLKIDLKNAILKLKIPFPDEYKNVEKNMFDMHLKAHFNKSQVNGIISSTKQILSLVQGPPGTGKTRTIIGVIIACIIRKIFRIKNILFTKKQNHFLKYFKEKNLNTIQYNEIKKKMSFCKEEEKIRQRKSLVDDNKIFDLRKVLVCAPSNAAIDENASRSTFGYPFQKIHFVWKIGKILRVGPNYHELLDHICLENLTLIWLSENDSRIKFKPSNRLYTITKNYIVNSSRIIFTTMACSSYSIFKNKANGYNIVIDEAAQAIETSTIIPIVNKCNKLILIGDVQQLPATLFSKGSIKANYDRSLFKRLQLGNFRVLFLETQYRMHPQISSFPARKFYMNGLKDSVKTFTTVKYHILKVFGPLVFFDVCDGFERNHLDQYYSWCNIDEARVISMLTRLLICVSPEIFKSSCGIISAYNGQVIELESYRRSTENRIKSQIGTVDGFQGKEKDLIFFSSVRSRAEKGIGFLSDCRRMNVAFTRAKHSFWIIGNFFSLSFDQNWKEATVDLLRRNCTITLRKPYERSCRRVLFWSFLDNQNYILDGKIDNKINQTLQSYLFWERQTKKVII